jgi:hypothetical protein
LCLQEVVEDDRRLRHDRIVVVLDVQGGRDPTIPLHARALAITRLTASRLLVPIPEKALAI